tara:strand:- start:958 stop:1836 length:879 start_codon:yes stop_codon:yes gene_type:complete
MKVLITGASGQLGQALFRNRLDNFSLMLPSRNDLDLANEESCRSFIKENKPHWIINAGAYTNVEMAEENTREAFLVNTKAVSCFVEEIAKYNGSILQISTDYVFNGNFSKPINPLTSCDPLNYYGYTKLEAEKIVSNYPNSIIIRTSWLYGPIGKNFFLTIHKLLNNKEKNESIEIVCDQIGCPTSADSLSKACWHSLKINNLPKILHWSDLGSASWYDFAFYIRKILKDTNLLYNPPLIKPTKSANFFTKAKRPYYSVLDCWESYKCLNLKTNHWTFELEKVVNQYIQANG